MVLADVLDHINLDAAYCYRRVSSQVLDPKQFTAFQSYKEKKIKVVQCQVKTGGYEMFSRANRGDD